LAGRQGAPARGTPAHPVKTDYTHLYQVHWPDPGVPVEEIPVALADLVKEEKIPAVGVGNLSPAQTEAFRQIQPIQTTQPPHSLFERDVLPYAKRQRMVVLAYGARCRGLLSGKLTAVPVRRGRCPLAGMAFAPLLWSVNNRRNTWVVGRS
jgi:aryl-alcohol dehydrogenase-like predicted oxidoreductase